MYDKCFKEYEETKNDIGSKIRQLSDCNKKYYITPILFLVQRTSQIFESSGIEEKRQILNFISLNLQLDGKKLAFKVKTSLAEVSAYNDHRDWGRLRDVFRAYDWENIKEVVDVFTLIC